MSTLQPVLRMCRLTSGNKKHTGQDPSDRRPEKSWKRRLVVMLKEPRAGQVKTRLAAKIGAAPAACFYRQTTAALLSRITYPSEWDTILAVAPDSSLASSSWNRRWPRIPQGNGTLGQRMQRIMNSLPPGPVLIIGSDTPDIRPCDIRTAFAALGRHPAVFGPSPDGGYWLIGLKRQPRVPQIFAGVRWSSPHAREDTERNLKDHRIAYAVTLDDIDEVEDLIALGSRKGRLVLPARLA